LLRLQCNIFHISWNTWFKTDFTTREYQFEFSRFCSFIKDWYTAAIPSMLSRMIFYIYNSLSSLRSYLVQFHGSIYCKLWWLTIKLFFYNKQVSVLNSQLLSCQVKKKYNYSKKRWKLIILTAELFDQYTKTDKW